MWKKMNNTKLERMRQDFKDGNPIANFYPITLSNGSTIEAINTQCCDCKECVPDEHFRGVVSVFNNGDTVVNNAVGFCESCLTLWNINQRTKSYKDSFRVEYIHNGRWVTGYAIVNQSVFSQVITFLKSVFIVFTKQK